MAYGRARRGAARRLLPRAFFGRLPARLSTPLKLRDATRRGGAFRFSTPDAAPRRAAPFRKFIRRSGEGLLLEGGNRLSTGKQITVAKGGRVWRRVVSSRSAE